MFFVQVLQFLHICSILFVPTTGTFITIIALFLARFISASPTPAPLQEHDSASAHATDIVPVSETTAPIASSTALIATQRRYANTDEKRQTTWRTNQTFVYEGVSITGDRKVNLEHFTIFYQIAKHLHTTQDSGDADSQGHSAAGHILRQLERQPGFHDGDFKFGAVLGDVRSLQGLVWLAEA